MSPRQKAYAIVARVVRQWLALPPAPPPDLRAELERIAAAMELAGNPDGTPTKGR